VSRKAGGFRTRSARGPRLTGSKAFLLNALFVAFCVGTLVFMAYNYHRLSSLYARALAQNQHLEIVGNALLELDNLAGAVNATS
jgi:hypothetical protein